MPRLSKREAFDRTSDAKARGERADAGQRAVPECVLQGRVFGLVMRCGLLLLLCLLSVHLPASRTMAQVVSAEDSASVIERVEVILRNPSPDPAVNARVTDLVRRSVGLFPSGTFSRSTAEIGLSRARRAGPIAATDLSVSPGRDGALVVTVEVTLGAAVASDAARGALATGNPRDLPLLYDRNGVFVSTKLEFLTMFYANTDAWYGRPDLFLAGNPLVAGNAAGNGTTGWAEAFVHAGIYAIAPVSDNVFVYGGLSGILSGSVGQELFTDDTRHHFGVEDAYVGIVGGATSADGNRLVWNISAGRKRFAIGEGFLIANSASNGSTRAALQSNPRWAADMLVLGQVRYNTTLVEAFYLDPDELPAVDSRTKLAGVNFETRATPELEVGAAYIRVLESDFGYFATGPSSPAGVTMGRDGLEVFNLRGRWQPENSGLFVKAEAGWQRNSRFDMRASGVMGEVGYSFKDANWRPEVSYRVARFTGDDPATARFERWDPLLSGGNGEQWVQGINHFKVFQDSNLIAHRLQFRLRPGPKFELVPQFWLFKADSTTNLGGNPALSFLNGTDLAWEANLTVKWFLSKNAFVQGHIAATFPSSDVASASGAGDLDPWLSAMVFVRVAF
jgi:Alginate export